MTGLIFFVDRSGPVDVRELVHRVGVVERRLGHARLGERSHRLVVRVAATTRDESATAGDHLHRDVDHATEHPAVEGLAEVAHLVELVLRPGGFEELGVARQFRGRGVARFERFSDRFRCKHPGLDREVHALERRRVQEAGGVPHQAEAVTLQLGHRPVAAVGQRLGAVAQDLAALEQGADARVLFPLHEQCVGIEPGVLVVQANHKTQGQFVLGNAVHERAAVGVALERVGEILPDRQMRIEREGLKDHRHVASADVAAGGLR